MSRTHHKTLRRRHIDGDVISVRIPRKVLEQIDELARSEDLGFTRSQMVRRLIAAGLRQNATTGIRAAM